MNIYEYVEMSKAQLLRILVNIDEVASQVSEDISAILDYPEKHDQLITNTHIDTNDLFTKEKVEGSVSLEGMRKEAKAQGYRFFVFNDQIFLTDDDSLTSIFKHEEPTIEAIITIVAESSGKALDKLFENAPNSVLTLISRPFDVGGMYVIDAKLTKDGFIKIGWLSNVSLTQKVRG